MRTTRRTGMVLVASAFLPLVHLSACADSDEPMPPVSTGNLDSGTGAAEEATTPDAQADALDATADRETDAEASRCSASGFCHTDVPSDESFVAIWGDGEGVVWTVSAAGNIRSWDGTKWTVRFTAPTPLNCIWGTSPTDIWVGGPSGLLHGTGVSSATLEWSAVEALPGDENIPILSIWGANPEDVWAVGGNNDPVFQDDVYYGSTRLLHFAKSEDGGAPTWTLDSLSTGSLYASSGRGLDARKVWGSSDGDVWLGGNAYGGSLVEYPHQSLAIAFRRRATDTEWSEARFAADVSAKDLFLFGGATDGTSIWTSVLRQADPRLSYTVVRANAQTVMQIPIWNEVAPTPEWFANPAALRVNGANDIWYVGERVVLHFDGTKWNTVNISLTPSPMPNRYLDMWTSGPNDVWVVGDGIAAHKGP